MKNIDIADIGTLTNLKMALPLNSPELNFFLKRSKPYPARIAEIRVKNIFSLPLDTMENTGRWLKTSNRGSLHAIPREKTEMKADEAIVKEKAKAKPKAKPQPKAEEPPFENDHKSHDELKELCIEVSRAKSGNRDLVKKIISSFGVKRVTDLTPEDTTSAYDKMGEL